MKNQKWSNKRVQQIENSNQQIWGLKNQPIEAIQISDDGTEFLNNAVKVLTPYINLPEDQLFELLKHTYIAGLVDGQALGAEKVLKRVQEAVIHNAD